jgi:hypothetical protein
MKPFILIKGKCITKSDTELVSTGAVPNYLAQGAVLQKLTVVHLI